MAQLPPATRRSPALFSAHRHTKEQKSRGSRRFLLTSMLLLVGLFTLSSSTPADSIDAVAAKATSACVKAAGVTECTCEEGETGKTMEADLSQDANKLQIMCKGELKGSPKELEGEAVCPASTNKKCKCDDVPKSRGEDETTCIKIGDLLSANAGAVSWRAVSVQNSKEKPKLLTIPTDSFALVDEGFVVGCVDQLNTDTKCKVTVTLKARATVMDNRKVICAYGAESNGEHKAITLSPSQNSFTLVCGEKGEIVPANYVDAFCPLSEGSTTVATPCGGDYKTILAGYETAWWSDKPEGSFSFTIPKDKFPESGAKLMFQCQKKSDDSQQKPKAEVAKGPSVCSVDVTIEGRGPPSSAVSASVSGMLHLLLLFYQVLSRE
ncbi:SAG-related sequence [Besnoitia besnoiti]|uniref:SAG-related sequence n=1 Tax=Besnoitia besnoiti TaxID=94643 RepID=A0A2A9MFW4_BESBE|nr:SAG-related sequence [Besnoitia besnoiti]PFH36819.1 SAG-related sequence [Besnoitia besnoiti]